MPHFIPSKSAPRRNLGYMFQFGWHNTDYPQDIGKRLGQLLDLCGLTVEKHEVTVFPRPEGVPEEAESITHIYILSQSHLVLHTYPENDNLYLIDLHHCGLDGRAAFELREKIVAAIQLLFTPRDPREHICTLFRHVFEPGVSTPRGVVGADEWQLGGKA